MPDAPGFPATRAGDRLRCIIAARRLKARRSLLLAMTGVAALVVAASAFWKPPRLLVWNASGSAPIGLYWVERKAPARRGDMVIAWAPQRARSLAAARLYLPINVPLVKRVAAAAGDCVCATGKMIRIDGRRVATRLELDSRGRWMPWWTGCYTLAPGEYFLLMPSPLSFDGRYFGMTRTGDILGSARLVWAEPSTSDG